MTTPIKHPRFRFGCSLLCSSMLYTHLAGGQLSLLLKRERRKLERLLPAVWHLFFRLNGTEASSPVLLPVPFISGLCVAPRHPHSPSYSSFALSVLVSFDVKMIPPSSFSRSTFSFITVSALSGCSRTFCSNFPSHRFRPKTVRLHSWPPRHSRELVPTLSVKHCQRRCWFPPLFLSALSSVFTYSFVAGHHPSSFLSFS